MKDPYEVLGVAKTANEAEIKKAFRALAKKHHPDKHAGDAAAQKRFQEISGAYDILGDKEKRAQYDAGAIGADGNPRGFDPRQGGGTGGFRQGHPFGSGFGGGGPGAREFHFSFDDGAAGGGAAGFEDIFADLMGGARRGARQPRQTRGEDFSAAVTISFDEAATGGTRRVVLQNGEQIDVKIPVGTKDGQTIRVKGRGGAGQGGGANGDILLTVSVASHPTMTRDGSDIRMDLPVTLKEAILGGKVPVPTLTGTVSLTVPANSNTGTTLRLKGKGIAAHGETPAGDLYVRLVVALPDHPDEALKSFVSGWAGDYDPRVKIR
ncbi:MAG TPA: J domain-containing protein [Rhizomicrobium sp.]|jgi:DnaJ-class molecular chaperone|nr:J domain-containing protein [Rhizomicrobium sp.]